MYSFIHAKVNLDVWFLAQQFFILLFSVRVFCILLTVVNDVYRTLFSNLHSKHNSCPDVNHPIAAASVGWRISWFLWQKIQIPRSTYIAITTALCPTTTISWYIRWFRLQCFKLTFMWLRLLVLLVHVAIRILIEFSLSLIYISLVLNFSVSFIYWR